MAGESARRSGGGQKKTRNLFERIYVIVAQIPYGRVTTYGAVARMLGNPRLARAVGYALHVLPEERALPWHRVVNREGLISVPPVSGLNIQRLLLEEEGVAFTLEGKVDLTLYGWDGSEAEPE